MAGGGWQVHTWSRDSRVGLPFVYRAMSPAQLYSLEAVA